MPESMLDFLGIPSGDDKGPFSERYRVELLLKEGPRVTDEMVERAVKAMHDYIADDHEHARHILTAALEGKEPTDA